MLTLNLIIIGFISLSTQIILLRELLVLNYGNELSIGLLLSVWLLCTGLGSIWTSKFLVNSSNKFNLFIISQVILSLSLPLSIFLIRVVPKIFSISTGEISSLLLIISSGFIVLVPPTVLLGSLFISGTKIYSEISSKKIPAGYVYLFESIGATIGGLLSYIIFVKIPNTLFIMIFFSLLLCFVSILSIIKFSGLFKISRKVLYVQIFILSVLILSLIYKNKLHNVMLSLQWNTEVLQTENSVYQNITITKYNEQINFFTNGTLSFSLPDLQTNEFISHIPLLEHPLPKKVLVIGNATNEIINEILKHNIEKIDYVELDPLIIKLGYKYNTIQKNNKVNIIILDPRIFVYKTVQKYDVVIINQTEPKTALTNRFYTFEFYSQLKNILSSDGIISFVLSSNPNYLSEEQKKFYITLKRTLEKVFADVLITPGEHNHFLACKRKNILTSDWKMFVNRLKQRKIFTSYVREYYLYSDFSVERFQNLKNQLSTNVPSVREYSSLTTKDDNSKSPSLRNSLYHRQEPTTFSNGVNMLELINTDFKPISYYYNLILWLTHFRDFSYKILKLINSKNLYIIFSLIIVLFLIFMKYTKKVNHIYAVISTTGFSEMALQILILVVFQILYGYVYYKLTIIFTMFMFGLIVGSYFANRLKQKNITIKSLVYTQIAICLNSLIVIFVFNLLHHFRIMFLGSNFILPIFAPFLTGFLGGFQFPLVNSLLNQNYPVNFKSKNSITDIAGKTYSMDLFGSCIGGILVSILLIPVSGIYQTGIIIFILNLAGLIVLLYS